MTRMIGEVLSFRRLIAPVVIQVLFWGAAIASAIAGIWLIAEGSWGGWFAFFLGPLGARLVFEVAIVIFRIHDDIRDINTTVVSLADRQTEDRG
jgi:hypothetical protein